MLLVNNHFKLEKKMIIINRLNLSYRVVAVVAGNSEAVTLFGLSPDTQYQLTVAAVWNGRKYRSRPIVFRTLGTYLSCFIHLVELNAKLWYCSK